MQLTLVTVLVALSVLLMTKTVMNVDHLSTQDAVETAITLEPTTSVWLHVPKVKSLFF